MIPSMQTLGRTPMDTNFASFGELPNRDTKTLACHIASVSPGYDWAISLRLHLPSASQHADWIFIHLLQIAEDWPTTCVPLVADLCRFREQLDILSVILRNWRKFSYWKHSTVSCGSMNMMIILVQAVRSVCSLLGQYWIHRSARCPHHLRFVSYNSWRY